MQIIQLPLTRCMQIAGWGFVTACSALVLATPVTWLWRLVLATLVLVVGGLLWRRYLRRRPVALRASAIEGLICTRSCAHDIPVARITIGVMRPWLISAQLHGADGGRLDLFVPGCALSRAEHWRLRRTLLGFRPAGEPTGGSAD